MRIKLHAAVKLWYNSTILNKKGTKMKVGNRSKGGTRDQRIQARINKLVLDNIAKDKIIADLKLKLAAK